MIRKRLACATAAVTILLVAYAQVALAATIPFVGCPGDGQIGPVDAPLGDPVPIGAFPGVAHQLAYYKGNYGPGVIAPRGWRCRLWYGSSGSFVIVTPSGPENDIPVRPVMGPGVEIILRYGGTSGRFQLAAVSARYFPEIMRSFIQQIRDEHLGTDVTSNLKPYPYDQVRKITARMIEYRTPADRDGFGTESFAKSDQPIQGLAALSLPSDETTLSVLRMRLLPGQQELAESIIRIEANCLKTGTAC